MTEKIMVSVILTSYNHAKYLHEAISSVLNQTFTNFELIIWDDASTDESWQIINSFSDPRIQSFRNENHQIITSIKTAISEVAKGEYIAIHHSDDIWEPLKLEKQVAFLEKNTESGAVFSHALIIGESGQPFEDTSHFYYKIFDQPNRTRYEWLNYFFFHGNALCHPSVLIRKSCYEACGFYRYGLAQVPDFDMWIRLCMKYEIHIIPEKLVRFRVRSSEMNTSGNHPITRIRYPYELLQLFENFCGLRTAKDFLKVFPSAQKYVNQDYFDINYALGMISVESDTSMPAKLFGLNLLFKILNDADRAEKIYQAYKFSHMDFLALSVRYDIFSVELTPRLITENENLKHQIAEIHASRAWKFTLVLRKIWTFLK